MSANGQLKASELAPIAGGGHLAKDAAFAWNGFSKYLLAEHGIRVAVNDSYRPLGHPGDLARGVWSQWAAYEKYQAGGNLAAYPGTSNHGLGLAVDVPSFVQDAIHKYGDGFGFNKAKSDAPSEPWHFKWDGYIRPDLRDKWCATTDPVLTIGDKGPSTVVLKKLLKKQGYWPAVYPITAGFGRLTQNQVKRFQKSRHLAADGVVGDSTWKALRSAPKPKPKPTPKPPPAPKPKPVPKPKPKPNPNAIYFADIYEGDPYNAPQYKMAGYSHIMLKATEGHTFHDTTFPARFRESGHVGTTRWLYHFARPGNGNSPIDEAKNFTSYIDLAGQLNSSDRLVLDWEDPKFDGKSGDKWVADFIKQVGRANKTIRVIYSNASYIEGTLAKWPVDQHGVPLCYMHSAYNSHPEANVPAFAKPHLRAIQYTDGKNYGLNRPISAVGIGNCDMSYLV